ncbi:MAG TPA: elongation factor P maturation arginine rhamnosyltransferase EarP, partial [Thiotrichales bacterium]
VIEAFACELPAHYRQAMLKQASLCVNLDYFSCEDWVLGCHGLRSFQSDGLHKYFFFPGIVSGTGGVLYEADYEQQRLAFTLNEQLDWFERWQLPRAHTSSMRISLFGYENKAIISLLEQAADYPLPIELYCPMSKLCHELTTHFDQWQISAGNSYQLGNATIHFIPFLPQSEYDRLLWSCDLNFVRGEESLIRGLLAAKPLVWHIYPTEDQAHWIKLNAFIQVLSMPPLLAELTRNWNAQAALVNLTEVLNQLPQLQRYALGAQESILSMNDLSTNLVSFIESKV